MNKDILDPAVQEFLEDHFQQEVSEIALQGSPFPEVSPAELATQLAGKKKAQKKLPTWFKTPGVVYPPKLNVEQTSSETTAWYKANLINGKILVDLSGGFGVDSYHFSKNFESIYHCEINPDLSELAAHNLKLLGAKNIHYVQGDGLQFLQKSSEIFDWLYIDPSRRTQGGGRVFKLTDCEPNVPGELEFLLSKTRNLMLKTSPLLDISAGLEELDHVSEIHIIAVKNDVKELLWILGESTDSISVKTVNFTSTQAQEFAADLDQTAEVTLGKPESILYEPNAAIMKSGLFSSLGARYGLKKLHANTHLFTSGELVDFPGRRFRILEILPYNRKSIKKRFGGTKANISIRNFPESVANLRKQFKLKDGGAAYLFFTTLENNDKAVLVCDKINT